MDTPDLAGAKIAVGAAQGVVDAAVAHLAALDLDEHQVVAYDVAHAAAAVDTARQMLAYGELGDIEAALACAYIADTVHDLATKLIGRHPAWGLEREVLDDCIDFVAVHRDPEFVASLANRPGDRHLGDDFEMVQDMFRSFAEKEVAPRAEHVHRTNADVPEEIISGLSEVGGFGLSVPVEYGGFSEGGPSEYLGMVVATEELSRASLGIGGSLITRPEILTRALVKGGTEEQKQEWLPKIAAGEILNAVAVTEPDYGSDVAGVTVAAVPKEGGWVINGVKTWCTFAARADVLMVLARTNPDRSMGHRGLSIFIVPKPRGDGHGFEFTQDAGADGGAPGGGKMAGRAIDTIGYRGMHSYEVAFEEWWVPGTHLIGGDDGQGRGFYFQMEGFENGRLQTAARAVGVMQAAYEAAAEYAENRVVFGSAISEYQLTEAKLGRMAFLIQAARQSMYHCAKLMGAGEGALEASMVKAYVCKAAEWVTREALQIHGGMGYAEEYVVSRLFVDARVLSIFEGADETLALKVIIRRLIAQSETA
ncbi:MAG TPA: acyl-CoA dehydrogenase family protein [Acidimicrobiales bacterium]